LAAFLFVAADELHGELRFTAGVYRQRKIHQGRYPFKENVVGKLNEVRNLRVSMLAVVLEIPSTDDKPPPTLRVELSGLYR
jgi:hypothetical protein